MKYINRYRLITSCSLTILMAVKAADAPPFSETIDWSGSESSAPISLEPSHEFGTEGDAIHDSLRVPNHDVEMALPSEEPLEPIGIQLDQGLPEPGLTTQMDPAVTEQAVVEKDIPSPISVAAPSENHQAPQAANEVVLQAPITREQAEQKYDAANAEDGVSSPATSLAPVGNLQPLSKGTESLEMSAPLESESVPPTLPEPSQMTAPVSSFIGAAPQPPENNISQEPVVSATAPVVSVPAMNQPQQQKEFKEDAIPHQDEQPTVDEIEGIDTVSLAEPQGNWLFKRIWWERAEQKYEKIRKRVADILESRMKFFTQRSELDKNVFEPFYLEIGLAGGELQGRLSDFIDSFKKQQEAGQPLDSQKRQLLAKAQEDLAALEQLQKEIASVTMLNQNVDTAIDKLLEQINTVRQYEQDAWLKFKEIARVLSEKTARELFFQMDVTSKNIHDIQIYLEGPFATHFNEVAEAAKHQIARIRNSLSLLKEKGIDIKQYFDSLKVPQKQVIQETPEEDEEEEMVAPKGFIAGIFDSVWSGIKGIGSFVVSIVRWPYDLIVGPKTVEDDSDETKNVD